MAATDAYGNPSNVAPDELIESAWGNSVAARVLRTFPNKTALLTWAAPNGARAITTDKNWVWQRIAGAWVVIGGARIGFGAVNPGQAWAVGQTQSMTWPSERFDTDGFAAGGAAITVPADLGGMYSITAQVNGLVANAGGATFVQIVIAAAIVAQSYISVGVGMISIATQFEMTAGQNVQLQIINGHSGAGMSYNGSITVVRTGP